MNTANTEAAAAVPCQNSEKLEAIQLQEKESRQQCERQLAARQAMSDSDKRRMEELGAELKPHCICNLCKNVLLEPWLVKDCGHLYCFRCLHSIVYEKQHRRCPACGPGGSVDMNEDAFGAFKVVVDANNNRKVAREGSKFLYDDSADSLIRMLWPDRVQEYVTADVEREQRRLEDLAARKHFEISVQGDRLANPSSTNPGMAAGRVRSSGAGSQGASRGRGSIQLKAPPLKLQMPLISTGVARSAAAEQHMHMVLLSPMHMTLSEEMKKWASDNSLLEDHAVLPPLMKPYLRLPFDQLTLWALKEVLVAGINNRDFWHDKVLPYPAAGVLTSNDVALYVDWTQRTAETPSYVLSQELPDDSELEPHLSQDDPPYSLLAVHDFLIEQHVNVGVSLDLVYCLRPEAAERFKANREPNS